MENRNNNIEDFFRRSTEQFRESPSDRVWEGLALQLNTLHVPFYRKIQFWIRGLIALGFIGLIILGFVYAKNTFFILPQKVQHLEKKNLLLLNRIDSLEEALACQGLEPISPIKKEKTPSSESLLSAQHTGLDAKQLAFSSTQKPDILRTPPESHREYPPSSDASLHSSAQHLPYSTTLNLHKPSKNSVQDEKIRIERPLNTLQLNPLLSTEFKEKKHAPKAKKERLHTLSNLNLNFSNLSFSSAKVGISGMAFNSFLNIRTQANPGYKLGLVSDFKLSRKLSLSTSLMYNSLTYRPRIGDFRNGATVITLPDTLNGEIVQAPVSEYQSHIQSWDLNIGFKWYLIKFTNGNRLFLHPSASIQRSQLLRTTYTFRNQEIEKEYRGQFFAKSSNTLPRFHFFQSTQVQLGIERNINKQTFLQLGIWAHKRWWSYGAPGGRPSAIGLQASLLFQPKRNKGY